MEETRALAQENKRELSHLKQFLMPPSADDLSDASANLSRPLRSEEELMNFCNKLGDAPFRKSVVSGECFVMLTGVGILLINYEEGLSVKR